MQIEEMFIEKNDFSRCGKKRKETLGIVMHNTGVRNQSAKSARDYFDVLGKLKVQYASAHYVVGLHGEVVQVMPDDEVAYHAGSSIKDRESGKVYTDTARKLFGKYASEQNSPNNCTIGIELCQIDEIGNFTGDTLESAAELVAMLCKKYNITTDKITTHNEVVGWKDCPRLWTENPELFHGFVLAVERKLSNNS